VNSAWCFAKFRGLPWQIQDNSVIDNHLNENQFSCSKYLIYCHLLMLLAQMMLMSLSYVWLGSKLCGS